MNGLLGGGTIARNCLFLSVNDCFCDGVVIFMGENIPKTCSRVSQVNNCVCHVCVTRVRLGKWK